MKKLFLLALPMTLAAVSCSNEEVVSVNNDANEIKFAVVAENGTRAQNLFCNITKPTNFHVWASVGDGAAAKQYFANASYTDNGSGTFLIDTDHRYWPAEGTAVDFFAVTEETTKAVTTPTASPAVYNDWTTGFGWGITSASTITWETRSLEAPKQTDLLYAYTRKSREDATAGTVGINFRHALSQIVFKAKNTNSTIEVEIDKVEVVNIAKGGVFTMPYGAANVTDSNINDHTTAGSYKTGVGEWNIQTLESNTAANNTYTTTQFTAKPVTSDGVNLTEETMGASTHSNFDLSLLLVPQKTTAWSKSGKPADQAGSYFKVYCRIKNVSGAEGGADLYLWGSEAATEAVYIPVAANWEPGKKYIYTFNFGGDTTGGYDEDGDPVLIPISFTITVDDFVKVDNNVDMK